MQAIPALIVSVHTNLHMKGFSTLTMEVVTLSRRESGFYVTSVLPCTSPLPISLAQSCFNFPTILCSLRWTLPHRFSKTPFPTIADAGLPNRNGIPVRSIWYSERGFEVSAEACINGLRILFQLSTHPCFRQSVKSRIAACHYELPFVDTTETFPDPDPAREAVSSSMTTVWDAGSNHPFIEMPECIAPAKPHISHDGGTDEIVMEIHAQTRNLGRSMEA